jgi:hypothetical protein
MDQEKFARGILRLMRHANQRQYLRARRQRRCRWRISKRELLSGQIALARH